MPFHAGIFINQLVYKELPTRKWELGNLKRNKILAGCFKEGKNLYSLYFRLFVFARIKQLTQGKISKLRFPSWQTRSEAFCFHC